MNAQTILAACIVLTLEGCGGNATPAPTPSILFCCPAATAEYTAVAERGANDIALYPGTPVPEDLPGPTVSAPGAESFALGLGSTPPLYVGEYPSTVSIFDYPYKSAASTITSGISDPASLAVGIVNGSQALFVANRGSNTIAIYEGADPSAPAVTITGLHAPDGLTFDAHGNLWVAEASDVLEFAPPFTAGSTPAVTVTSGLKAPSGIAFDENGVMYVADKGDNAIVVYSESSTQYFLVTGAVDGPGNLLITAPGTWFPQQLFVPNTSSNSVAQYGLPLVPGSEPQVLTTVQMNEPSAITFLTLPN
jgi:hypothetical protein